MYLLFHHIFTLQFKRSKILVKLVRKISMINAYEGHSPGSKLLPRRRFPGNLIFNSGKTFFI